MLTKSIRWRLQAWHGLMLVAVLTGFGFTAYHVALDNQVRRLDRELEHQLMQVGHRPLRGPMEGFNGQPPEGPPEGRGFGPPGGRPGLREWAVSVSPSDFSQTNGFYYVVWQMNGAEVQRSSNAPVRVPMPEAPATAALTNLTVFPDEPRHHRLPPPMPAVARSRGEYRELFRFEPFGQCVLVGRSMASDLAAMHRLAWWLVAAGAGVLALGLAGGWWMASRAIRPIEDISATALKIAGGDLSQRINAADAESELGHLAAVLNATFARLEAAFAQQKQFTADASHELRTPLAVIISEAQTTLARERGAAEYRETIEGCLGAAQQMRRLTESLLQLARFDAGEESLKPERFDLGQLVQDTVTLLRPLAEQRGLSLQSKLPSVACVGDPERIRQVATNLITNAIHFNRPGGDIDVTVENAGHSAVLKVTDTGLGIEAQDLPRIFERFYRADKARSREQGGTGLGLAICKAIVDAHSGSIKVSSQPGVGSSFVVSLPLA
jgi:two-component system, OmpR family, sensor kinase